MHTYDYFDEMTMKIILLCLQSVFIGIAAVAVLGIGAIGAFAVANELNNLRDDIESNDGDISTLQTRTNGACNSLNTLGNIAAVPAAGNMMQNAIAINAIIAAANGASCT